MMSPQQNNNPMFQMLNGNPLFLRAQQMAEGKSPEEIQQIALNICKERGLDFETMLQQFQSQFKF